MKKRSIIQQSALLMAVFLVTIGGILFGSGGMVIAQGYPTSTPTSAQIQLPTATATQVGGPTATPSRTPTITPVSATALGTPTNLRSGPALQFDIVGVLSEGDTLPVVGRSVTLPWLQVAWVDGPDGKAWVYNELVQINGDITTVPVVDAPALPTIDPELAAQGETATVIYQTPGAIETATAASFLQPTGVYTITPGAAGLAAGLLPTFTPPEPLAQQKELPPAPEASHGIFGVPPAVVIISLGAMGVLSLGLGLLRRTL